MFRRGASPGAGDGRERFADGQRPVQVEVGLRGVGLFSACPGLGRLQIRRPGGKGRQEGRQQAGSALLGLASAAGLLSLRSEKR